MRKRGNLFVLSLIAVVLVGLVIFISVNIWSMTGGVIGVSWIGNLFGSLKITGNAVNLDDGLIAYYNFEGDVKDKSGTGNDGENHGAVFVDGREGLGKAGRFSGKEYVVINKHPAIANLSKGTISVWALYTNNTIYFEQILSTYNDGTTGSWYLGRVYSPYTVFGAEGLNITQSSIDIVSFKDDYASEWNHYLIAWDGTTVKGYFNGNFVSSAPQLPEFEVFTTGVYNSAIGGFSHNIIPITGLFRGLIDEARIYNRDLSEKEITEIYNYRNPVEKLEENETIENETIENFTDGNESIVNYTIPGIINQTNHTGEEINKEEENKTEFKVNQTLPEPEKECKLIDARWERENVTEGERVKLVLDSEGCDGKEARFVIEEYDELSANDAVGIEPGSVVVKNGKAETYWNAEWQCDGAKVFGECIGGKPEYKFTVLVNPEIESENMLTVNEAGAVYGLQGSEGNPDLMALIEKSPECGDGIVQIGEECDDWHISGGGCTSDCKMPGKGDCPDGYVRNISQWNVTYYFDGCYRAGQFANGDFWVLGPVIITKITPEFIYNQTEYNDVSCTNASGSADDNMCSNLSANPLYSNIFGEFSMGDRGCASGSGGGGDCMGRCDKVIRKCYYTLWGIHGFEINPWTGPGTDEVPGLDQQGFDGRSTDSTKSDFNASLVPNLPVTVSGNSSVFKMISRPEYRPIMLSATVLSVVDSVPPDGGATVFRQPYIKITGIKPYYSVRDLHTEFLPNLPKVGAPYPWKYGEFLTLRRVQFQHRSVGQGYVLKPAMNQHHYQLDEAVAVDGPAINQLMLDFPLDEKVPVLFGMIQKGIDMYEVMNESSFDWPFARGNIFKGGDGVSPGYQASVIFAAGLFNSSVMKENIKRRPWTTEMYYSKPSRLYNGLVVYGGHETPTDYVDTEYVENTYWRGVHYSGAEYKETMDPYGYIDGGYKGGGGAYMYHMLGAWRAVFLQSYLIPSVGEAYNGSILKLTDRFMGLGLWTQPDLCAPPIGVCGGPYNEGKPCTFANQVMACRDGRSRQEVVSECLFNVCNAASGNQGKSCGYDALDATRNGYADEFKPEVAGLLPGGGFKVWLNSTSWEDSKIWFANHNWVGKVNGIFGLYNYKYCSISGCTENLKYFKNYSEPHGYGPDPRDPPNSATGYSGDCIYDTDPSDGIGRVPLLHASPAIRPGDGYFDPLSDAMWFAYRGEYCMDGVCNGDENYVSCPVDCDSSLKLRIDFNEDWNITKVARDKSGYGNDATCQKPFFYYNNEPSVTVAGDQCPKQVEFKGVKAAEFFTKRSCDMNGDYFGIDKSGSLDNLSQGTISIWVNYRVVPRGPELHLLNTFDTTQDGSWFFGGQGQGAVFGLSNNSQLIETGDGAMEIFELGKPIADEWNLYTVTWNGTEITGYINGKKNVSGAQVYPALMLGKNTKYIAIGASPHGAFRNNEDTNCIGYYKCMDLCDEGCDPDTRIGCPFDPWDDRVIYNKDGTIADARNWTCCKDASGGILFYNATRFSTDEAYRNLFPKYVYPNNGFFNGLMSDIRIYNRSLSEREINYYYGKTFTKYLPAVCDNGYVEAGEACDGLNLNGMSCLSGAGKQYGIPMCNSSCTGYDFSYCADMPTTCENCNEIFGDGCNTEKCQYLGISEGRHYEGDCYFDNKQNECVNMDTACDEIIKSCYDVNPEECKKGVCGSFDCRRWDNKCVPEDKSLILHYDFEDKFSSNIVKDAEGFNHSIIKDKSGYGNDGICHLEHNYTTVILNLCPQPVTSQDNSTAARFVKNYMFEQNIGFSVEDKSSFINMSEGTAVIWVKILSTETVSISTFLGGGLQFPNTWAIGIPETYGDVHFSVTDSTGQKTQSRYSARNAKWNQYVVTWDGANIAGYLNGGRVGEVQQGALKFNPFLFGNNNKFYIFIGNNPYESSHTSADIDDVMIYNRSLDSEEIAKLYSISMGTEGFNVVLSSPQNNSITNSASISFLCSASYNTTISNLALYGNWAGSWGLSESKTANSGSATFTKSLPEGTFKWSCLATADTGETKFASSNYTIVVDRTAPTITINSPSNTNYSNRIISVNIGLSEAGSCTYRVNSSDGEHSIANIAGLNHGGNTAPLPNGEYSFRVTCADLAGNSGTGYVTFGVNSSSICGDGKIDLGDEECDGTNITASCQYGGSVSCAASCAVNYTLCNSAPVDSGGNGGGGGGGSNRVNNTQGTNNSNIGASGNKGEGTDEGINVTKIIETLGGGNTPMRKSVGTIIFVGIMAVLIGGIVFVSIVIVRRISKMNVVNGIIIGNKMNSGGASA